MITNVLQYLEDSAVAAPHKTAFSDENSSITYGQLITNSKALGTKLSRRLSYARNLPIYIHLSRTISDVVAILGVLYSGNFYIPFDPLTPILRADNMRRVIPPALELTCEEAPSASNGSIDHNLIREIRRKAMGTDPLYCMFTSGSTGVPKAVVISHNSVINMAEQFTACFGINESTVFGNQAPFDFDVSVKDIYLTLKNRATTHILPRRLFTLTPKLIEALNHNMVNTLVWSVSAMKIITALGTFPDYLPKHVKLVMFSGEVLPVNVLNQWRKHLPNTEFVNLYGPTEITCNCTFYRIGKEFLPHQRIPIGKAFPNTEVILLDDDHPVTEPYRPGELCVGGICLALGYYNNLMETGKVFRQNPLVNTYPQRIYCTGDICHYNQDGELEFLGRRDSQVKYMGHRIELGEIEIAALALPFVESVCCFLDPNRDRIVLFYQSAREQNADLARALKLSLPKHMVPARILHRHELPATRTGKIDRTALKHELDEPLE